MVRASITVLVLVLFIFTSCDEPLEPVSQVTSKLPIVINEFLASHINPTDEDWIELYNTSDSTVMLRDFYLTDSLTYPNRWRMPDTSVSPRGFLLVWADNQPLSGLHANFKLEKDGEQIGIFKSEGITFSIVDSLTFSTQKPDTSYGRFPDGEPQWTFFPLPTPGMANR